MRNSHVVAAALVMMLAAGAPIAAHHSFAAEFDGSKPVTLRGTITKMEWTNPHVWIHITAPDENGAMREWGFEMQAIAQDYAAGWRADSVKPGDKISIEYHPLKDGARGGQLMSADLSSGKHLGPPANPRTLTDEERAAANATAQKRPAQ